ncbi:LacI family DNA-binding transcriptional regulator [Streptomyces sp. DSM 44915]|uniref:LacI family DNA-binding transcriptional regulator n=1 Tax=Streptomyces chisholmiae TaxID=3075540 RepID=A0ABU2JZ26_9ACTN|nr:LacI family DNA-binding transcriptional regulator [Streptomyces sp. DSM 44915]MDT0270197.1 LacI family DNA-binding transcriptional regulator [Streptomyces sp. DSM 44915]
MVEPRPRGAREGKKPPTIHEVARLAGLSHQTVSRFLRKDPTMRPETTRRVAAAVAELGYRPNLAARSMRTRRTDRITVILPGAVERMPTRVLGGAAAAAREAGYLLDVVSLEGDAAARAERLRALLQPENTDGILSFTSLTDDFDGELAGAPVPVVVDGAYDDNMRSLGPFAEASMGAELIRHLADLGHRRFAHVAGHPDWPSARARRAVYEATVAELGLESRAVVEGDWSAGSGWEAATGVLADCGATAVFAASDQVAFGVITGFQSIGLRVPEDVSVFGWDDLELSRFFRPSLTTVAVDRERQGRDAVHRLLAVLRGESGAAGPLAHFNRVILRDSTGLPPAADARRRRGAPPRGRNRRPTPDDPNRA